MGAPQCFYIRPLKSSIKHLHNKGVRRPCWTDFHLALCVGESHLVFGVGAEGSKPSCPDYGETAFLCNPLSFTDIIHVQIILGPIVHPLRFQILAESSDTCNGRAGDKFHMSKKINKGISERSHLSKGGKLTSYNKFWVVLKCLPVCVFENVPFVLKNVQSLVSIALT